VAGVAQAIQFFHESILAVKLLKQVVFAVKLDGLAVDQNESCFFIRFYREGTSDIFVKDIV
jgi:hypothetical protein